MPPTVGRCRTGARAPVGDSGGPAPRTPTGGGQNREHGPARDAACAADARQAGATHPARHAATRRSGTASAHRVPRRRRGRDRQPHRQAADQVLPRAGRRRCGPSCRRAACWTARSSSRRGGRLDFDALLERIHPAAVPGAPRWPSGRPRASSPSTCWHWATTALLDAPLHASGAAALAEALAGARAAGAPGPRHHRRRMAARAGSSSSRARGWTGSSPSPRPRATGRTSGSCSRSSTSVRRTAWWRASAGTRAGRWWARCCSGCTTPPGGSSTSASAPSFPMKRRASWSTELAAAADGVGRRGTPGRRGRARRRRRRPAAGRAEPVDGEEGPVLAAAAAGAGVRGRLRPHAGRPLPAHRAVPPLAPGPRRRTSCTYAQLEEPVGYDLAEILGGA